MGKNKISNNFVIENLEVLKAVADPLRAQIFEILAAAPHTVKQVADKLGLAPGKLYYHFSVLEKHGLILVVDTRMVANMQEKWYRSVATRLDVHPSLLSTSTDAGKDTLYTFINSALDTTREDLLRSLQARFFQLEQGAQEQPRAVILNRQVCVVSEERAHEFQDRLRSLLQDFESAEKEGAPAEGMPYALTVAFYPSFHFEETPSESPPAQGETND